MFSKCVCLTKAAVLDLPALGPGPPQPYAFDQVYDSRQEPYCPRGVPSCV